MQQASLTALPIVVVGGSGLIGSRVIKRLQQMGHKAVSASPRTGIDTITGKGLAEAIKGASVVIDVANAPSWADDEVLNFFQTSTRNLLSAEAAAGVSHHIALSIVGVDGLPDCGYFRAKVAQEELIRASSVPYTIVRATQFFEFIGPLADSMGAAGDTVRMPDAQLQPIAADDVGLALAEIAVNPPVNGIIDLAGPETLSMEDFARRSLKANGKASEVTTDAAQTYYGAKLATHSLTAGEDARIGTTFFDEWLKTSAPQA
jgi:uncharacterized protein YbjT (DUF2867 family)